MTYVLFKNATLATFNSEKNGYGLIEKAGIAFEDDRIIFVGKDTEIPASLAQKGPVVDLEGRLVTPGFIDCHTHLVYGGRRSSEFEARLNGISYQDIAREGGGIMSTVKATRKADAAQLLREANKRLQRLLQEGVTTVEIKSGYGLDLPNEIKMLKAARALADEKTVSITTTLLAAHAFPPEYKNNRQAYIDFICEHLIPTVAQKNLCEAVDAFCEKIAFTTQECERVFQASHKVGLRVKLHGDQLSNGHGALLGARHRALSVDHLEYTDVNGVEAMAKAGTVAVLLPAAFYTLRETQAPPIKLFRRYGVPMAVASDMNPGTSPVTSFLSCLNMACVLFDLTPKEALYGATVYAAKALGFTDRGVLKEGLRADMAVWDLESPVELVYSIGGQPCYKRFVGGQECTPSTGY